ncbi:TPA: hypothetical protein EYG96_01455, partial [Candidatus Gracilibacteria bacterium]|nr:hypothetical protein [Candidatus Gracilibacteria bacterium]
MSIFGTQLSSAHNFLFLEKRLVCGITAPRANRSDKILEKAWNLKLITAIKEIKNDSSNETEQLRKAVEGSIKLNRANDKIVDTMNESEAKNILQAVLGMNVLGEDFNGIPAKYKRVCVLALQTRLASLGYMPA